MHSILSLAVVSTMTKVIQEERVYLVHRLQLVEGN